MKYVAALRFRPDSCTAGLRLLETLSIRVKDLSFERGEIVVRAGKGGHDRLAMLPRSLADDLKRQLRHVRALHDRMCGRVPAG
jgi:integrase